MEVRLYYKIYKKKLDLILESWDKIKLKKKKKSPLKINSNTATSKVYLSTQKGN